MPVCLEERRTPGGTWRCRAWSGFGHAFCWQHRRQRQAGEHMTTKTRRTKGEHLTDGQRIALREDIRAGKLTRAQMMKKHNVSKVTVKRYTKDIETARAALGVEKTIRKNTADAIASRVDALAAAGVGTAGAPRALRPMPEKTNAMMRATSIGDVCVVVIQANVSLSDALAFTAEALHEARFGVRWGKS